MRVIGKRINGIEFTLVELNGTKYFFGKGEELIISNHSKRDVPKIKRLPTKTADSQTHFVQ